MQYIIILLIVIGLVVNGENFYPVYNQNNVTIEYTDGYSLTFSLKKEDDAANKIQQIPSDKE